MYAKCFREAKIIFGIENNDGIIETAQIIIINFHYISDVFSRINNY